MPFEFLVAGYVAGALSWLFTELTPIARILGDRSQTREDRLSAASRKWSEAGGLLSVLTRAMIWPAVTVLCVISVLALFLEFLIPPYVLAWLAVLTESVTTATLSLVVGLWVWIGLQEAAVENGFSIAAGVTAALFVSRLFPFLIHGARKYLI